LKTWITRLKHLLRSRPRAAKSSAPGPRCVLTFHSTHDALRAEKLLLQAGLHPQCIPVPRQLSANCGIALCLPPTDCQQAESLLAQQGVTLGGTHLLDAAGR
jgi:hypothetical protein